MKRLNHVRLLVLFLLLTILLMRCGCEPTSNVPRRGLQFVTPSKEEVFTHLVDMLQIVKSNEENMCGMFSAKKDISEGEIIQKTDREGGTYKYSLKIYNKDGSDPMLNSSTNTAFQEPLSHVKTGDKVFLHEFNHYAGDFKRIHGSGPVIKITGEIIGTQWDPDKGTLRLDGGLGINTLGISDSAAKVYDLDDAVYDVKDSIKSFGKVLSFTSFHIRHLGIDNGPDGNKRGKLESLVKLSSNKSHNEIFISGTSIKINMKDKNDSQYKDWLQKFISCDIGETQPKEINVSDESS